MVVKSTVSVIITTYYRNDRLSDAIESVVNQTYNPIEIIIVDDSGEQHAAKVVGDYDVKYVAKDSNEGQISAWNSGISVSNGDYIQFLDDDDELSPTKIEKQVSKLESDSDVGVVYCGMQWESGSISTPDANLRGDVLEEVLTLDTSPCVTSTILMRRSVVEDIYPIPEYPASTDDVLKIELAKITEFDFVDAPLIIRGVGEDNVGVKQKVDSWKRIISEYNELYSSQPDRVYDKAISKIYLKQGEYLLKSNFWSIRSRMLLLYAVYRSPDLEKNMIICFIQSFVGLRMFESIKNFLDIFTNKSKICIYFSYIFLSFVSIWN